MHTKPITTQCLGIPRQVYTIIFDAKQNTTVRQERDCLLYVDRTCYKVMQLYTLWFSLILTILFHVIEFNG